MHWGTTGCCCFVEIIYSGLVLLLVVCISMKDCCENVHVLFLLQCCISIALKKSTFLCPAVDKWAFLDMFYKNESETMSG